MYLALARKYRPQQFKDLIGQPHITKTLQNAISMDKLYPSLIFSGMKGVGKTSAARILAKALNCERGPAVEPCNECQFCIEITEDKSPDYIEIDGASNNGIEEVRSLREKVKYKPIKNRYRVIVIDEVHMLSNSAWNALLKTVEEPPEFTFFIMATTDFHKIPATIVSRCQHFEFKRIPYEVITKLLRQIGDREKIQVSDYALYLIAKSSEGSLRDAKKVLDQAIALSSGDVKDKDVVDILAIIEEEIFIHLIRNIFEQNRKEIIQQVHNLTERGLDLRYFYTEFLKFLRDLLVLKSLDESENLHGLNPENIPEIKEIIKNVREIELLRYFNAAKDLEITVKNTENPRIILEYLFLKLSYFPSLIPIEEMINNVKGNPSLSIPPQTSTMQPEPPPPVPPPAQMQEIPDPSPPASAPSPGGIQLEKVTRFLLEKLGNEKPRLGSCLGAARFSLEGQVLVVLFPHKASSSQKVAENHIDLIRESVSQVESRITDIRVEVDPEATLDKEEEEISKIKNDKAINNLTDKIKGRIISIESVKEE